MTDATRAGEDETPRQRWERNHLLAGAVGAMHRHHAVGVRRGPTEAKALQRQKLPVAKGFWQAEAAAALVLAIRDDILWRQIEPRTSNDKIGAWVNQHVLAVIVDAVASPSRLAGDQPDTFCSTAHLAVRYFVF
jgi:hypothetical protein